MKIDKVVEPAVREAFAASVAEEPDRFNAVVAEIADRGEDFTRDAVVLAVAVDAMALLALHDGERLDEEELTAFARDFVESQGWADIAAADAHRFLVAISGTERRLPDVLPLGDLGLISFALGGWLLSAFLPEGMDWTHLLDELLDVLESAPEP